VNLGAQYEVDFAFFDLTSFGAEWNLIEIEAPSQRMFTKGGNPTAPLTHAIQQVRDWQAWVHENLDYARKLMPKIEYPMGHVFIGRRADLTLAARRKLRRLAYEHPSFLHIHTLDWFAGAAHSVKDLLRGTPGNWAVPMQALSHADLAAGKPVPALKALRRFPNRLRDLEDDRDLLLTQREHSYLNLAEYAEDDSE